MIEVKKLVPKRRFEGFKEDWEETKLKELSVFSKGRGYSKKDLRSSGHPLILYGRLYTNYETIVSRVDSYTVKKENSVISRGGEVVVPSSGETKEDIARASVISMPDIILGGDLNIIKTSDELEPVFLALSISNGTPQQELIKRAQGSSVVHIYNEDLMNISLYYPHIKEQQKIGEFFKVLDDRIANQERKIAKVKALKSAYLTEMFPQEGETVPKRRFKGFEGEWNKKRLNDLGEILTGSTPSTNKPEYYSNEGVPWVTPTDIKENITLVTDKHLSEKGQKVARIVPENTILVTSIASIGKNTILGTVGSFNQQINGLIPNQNENNPYFLYVASTLWSIELANKAASGTMQIVNKTEFSNLKVMIPFLAEQQKIGSFFKNLDDQITTEEKNLEKLKKMKEAYLEEMFV